MKKMFIAFMLCTAVHFSGYSQQPFITGSTGATGASTSTSEDPATGCVGVGIDPTTTSDAALAISNFKRVLNSVVPTNILLGIGNVVPGTTLGTGSSEFGIACVRVDNVTHAGLALDFSVNAEGSVGVGAPGSARFNITDPDPSGTADLMNIFTNQSIQSLKVSSAGNVGIGRGTPAAHLDITDPASNILPLLMATAFGASHPILYVDNSANLADGVVSIGDVPSVISGTDFVLQVHGNTIMGGDLAVFGNIAGLGLLDLGVDGDNDGKINIRGTSLTASDYAIRATLSDDATKAIQIRQDNGSSITDRFTVYGDGKAVMTKMQMTNGATSGYILQSDASGNAIWVDPATLSSALGSGLWGTVGNDIYSTNYAGVGIGVAGMVGSAGGPLPSQLFVGNMSANSTTPNIIAAFINQTSSPLPGPGNSDLSLFVGRMDGSSSDPSMDLVVDKKGMVGMGAPGETFGANGAHLGIINPDLSSTADLLHIMVNESTEGVVVDHKGMVGIGTATPTHSLEVVGATMTTDLRMTHGATNGYVLQSDASGNASWVDPTSLSVSGLWTQSGNNIYNNNTANVGVGTSTPSSSLTIHTSGSTPANGLEIQNVEAYNSGISSGSTNHPSFVINRHGTYVPAKDADHVTVDRDGADFIVNGLGYTGVGTASPQSKLHVVSTNAYDDAFTVSETATGAFTPALGVEALGHTVIGTTFPDAQLTIEARSADDNIIWASPYDATDERNHAPSFVVSKVGKVGIGTGTPAQALQVVGTTMTTNLKMTNGATAGYVMQSDASGNSAWVDPASLSSSVWAVSGNNIHNINSGQVDITGKLLIGTLPAITAGSPLDNNYSLYVAKGVIAESFKVAPSTSVDWFDMVFDSNYPLKPISDVAQYVKANHHLPDFPSGDEVAKNGIDVAKMDGKLLQKIEELTLYVIQLKGELEEMKAAKK